MPHASVGDFGPLLNHSLNRIGCFVCDHGLSAEDCVAIFEAGLFARNRLIGPCAPLPNPGAVTRADLRPDLFADQQRAA